MKAIVLGAALTLLALAACKKKDDGVPAKPGTTTSGAATGAATGTTPQIPPAPPAPPMMALPTLDGGGAREVIADPNKAGDWVTRTVSPLLEKEAKARPTGTPKAEDVLSAIEKQGVKLSGKNQALGSIIGAAFCMGADTESMVGVMVCEYADEAAAQKGAQLAKQIFSLAMPMTVLLKQKTSLSISNLTETAATALEAKKISDAFSSL